MTLNVDKCKSMHVEYNYIRTTYTMGNKNVQTSVCMQILIIQGTFHNKLQYGTYLVVRGQIQYVTFKIQEIILLGYSSKFYCIFFYFLSTF